MGLEWIDLLAHAGHEAALVVDGHAECPRRAPERQDLKCCLLVRKVFEFGSNLTGPVDSKHAIHVYFGGTVEARQLQYRERIEIMDELQQSMTLVVVLRHHEDRESKTAKGAGLHTCAARGKKIRSGYARSPF